MRRKCPYTARKKKKNHHRQLDLCRFYHLVTEKVLFFGVLLENSMKHADVCAPSRLVRCRCLPQSLRLWAASQERCGRASLRSELRNRSQRWGVGRTDKATLQAVLHRCTEGKKQNNGEQKVFMCQVNFRNHGLKCSSKIAITNIDNFTVWKALQKDPTESQHTNNGLSE